MTTETTPGRAAYEARLAAKSARLGFEITAPWDRLNGGNRADWEAAGAAAISAHRGPVGDAEALEAAAVVLERRYPGIRPDDLQHVLDILHALPRTWRRMAAGVKP